MHYILTYIKVIMRRVETIQRDSEILLHHIYIKLVTLVIRQAHGCRIAMILSSTGYRFKCYLLLTHDVIFNEAKVPGQFHE